MNNEHKQTILIVEDEPKLASLLADYLKTEGFGSFHIENGLEVMSWFHQNHPDLVLLDIMLPGKDGLTLCREIRESSEVPVIMVTARVDEIDRLLGLELGADDYICKPYSPREVVARVKAVLRRSANKDTQASSEDFPLNFSLNKETFEARYNGNLLDLTAVEFRLLDLFVNNPYKVYSREHLLQRIYTDQRVVGERTIDTHIKNLRKKLESIAPDQEFIRSIYGVGYKLEL